VPARRVHEAPTCWCLRFLHTDAEKFSFVLCLLATYFANIGAGRMNMNARLWLNMLRQWLDRPETEKENVDRRRALQDHSQLELRKTQATAWYFSPPY
jgi:hypothetical protein